MNIIKSSLLSKNQYLTHGISTKAGGIPPFYNNLSRHVGDNESNVIQSRNIFFGELEIDQTKLVHANQVHSNNVRIVTKPGLYKETDGLITAEKNLFLVISVADCLPVMIYDSRNQIVANIHAGWRGTQKQIVRRAIEILKGECNSNPEDLEVFLGPCIRQKNFEVGADVAALFDNAFVEKNNGRYYVDIIKHNTEQLKSFGIKTNQIEACGLCTYEETNLLHSYRRDREKSGRMFAIIGMKSK